MSSASPVENREHNAHFKDVATLNKSEQIQPRLDPKNPSPNPKALALTLTLAVARSKNYANGNRVKPSLMSHNLI